MNVINCDIKLPACYLLSACGNVCVLVCVFLFMSIFENVFPLPLCEYVCICA